MTTDSPSPSSADEQIAAHARAAHLVGLPWPDRLRIVRTDRSYAAPSFIELAIGLARDLGLPYLHRKEWARLAVEAARHGGSRRAEELEPLAWAVLGNLWRLLGDLRASRAAFLRCQPLRHRLVDPLELAETCSLESSYWSEMGVHADGLGPGGRAALSNAVELIDEALRLASPAAPDCVIANFEVQAGLAADRSQRWPVAMTMFLSALARLDPAENPRLALVAGHNLASTALGLGHIETARSAILRLHRLYDSSAEPALRLRREWITASIARAEGHEREAECRLQVVRDGFADYGMTYQIALVDLDLAALAAKSGRWPTTAHLAASALRAFSTAGATNAAWEATRLLREATARRSVGK